MSITSIYVFKFLNDACSSRIWKNQNVIFFCKIHISLELWIAFILLRMRFLFVQAKWLFKNVYRKKIYCKLHEYMNNHIFSSKAKLSLKFCKFMYKCIYSMALFAGWNKMYTYWGNMTTLNLKKKNPQIPKKN